MIWLSCNWVRGDEEELIGHELFREHRVIQRCVRSVLVSSLVTSVAGLHVPSSRINNIKVSNKWLWTFSYRGLYPSERGSWNSGNRPGFRRLCLRESGYSDKGWIRFLFAMQCALPASFKCWVCVFSMCIYVKVEHYCMYHKLLTLKVGISNTIGWMWSVFQGYI